MDQIVKITRLFALLGKQSGILTTIVLEIDAESDRKASLFD